RHPDRIRQHADPPQTPAFPPPRTGTGGLGHGYSPDPIHKRRNPLLRQSELPPLSAIGPLLHRHVPPHRAQQGIRDEARRFWRPFLSLLPFRMFQPSIDLLVALFEDHFPVLPEYLPHPALGSFGPVLENSFHVSGFHLLVQFHLRA